MREGGGIFIWWTMNSGRINNTVGTHQVGGLKNWILILHIDLTTVSIQTKDIQRPYPNELRNSTDIEYIWLDISSPIHYFSLKRNQINLHIERLRKKYRNGGQCIMYLLVILLTTTSLPHGIMSNNRVKSKDSTISNCYSAQSLDY